MSVVPFLKPEPPGKWMAGKARCAACQHEEVAVAPVGLDWMECGKCGLMKSRFMHPAVPGEYEEIWQCDCGCDVFMIVKGGDSFCINCGDRQRF